ncbi:tetratricopeptide repeat-containing sensor histidine kinase [Rhodohalobacter sp. SW132]|nr:tetratricopeptide repeat-containing sensor histidine kinase [Rhodohalobacter sp. SW132]
MLLLPVADLSSLNSEYSVQNEYPGQESPYYLLDLNDQGFQTIPKTEASVDSLLRLGFDQRDRDSRLSFEVARQALSIAYDIDYKEGMAGSHNLIGIKYIDFGDHELAHQNYLLALAIEEKLGNDSEIANILNNLSRIYVEQGNFDEAVKYLEASIERWNAVGENRRVLSTTNNLGVIYRREGNYDRALDYFWETVNRTIEQPEPDSLLYIVATLNIGNTYRNKGDLQRAKIHLFAARDFIVRNEYKSHQIFTDLVLGELYKDLGEYDYALAYASTAFELAREENYRENLKDAHLLLAQIYEDTENYQSAFDHFKQYHQIHDTLQTMQRGERIEEMQVRFDIEKKDREIDLLNKEAALQEARIAQQQQSRTFLIFGMILLLIIVVLLYRANLQRKKNNRELNQSRLEIQKQNIKLCNLNKEKDEFMSVAAHDLRNPITSISMAADLISSSPEIDRNTVHEYTGMIKVSANRMLTLINSLLDIQSISASRGGNNKVREVNMNTLVEESVQHFHRPASSKEIELKLILQRELTEIMGDPDNILRILDNLISNAIKYSPAKTSVSIVTEQKGRHVRISVRDQGPGITPEDQQKLFGKFTRLSNRPTGNESSTGLGLFIVKKIAESMDGKVWCESEQGCGSVFFVELPLNQNSRQHDARSRRKKVTAKL